LTGNSDANELKGGAGNDTLVGGRGADILDGGDGDNTADYALSSAGVSVNVSDDSYTTSGGTVIAAGKGLGGDAEGDTLSHIDNLTGSRYNDLFVAGAVGGKLSGQAGNDWFVAGAGADLILGGADVDTVDYSKSDSFVNVNLKTSVVTGGFASGDTIADIESVIGSSRNDILTGSAVANTLRGGDGDDLIEGLGGADILDGGNGNDTVSYAASTDMVTVNLSLSTAQVSRGDASGDVLSNFENVLGSKNDDSLTGNALVNTLTGGDGNDTLAGLGGADTLDGGQGIDTANYAASTQGVIVNLGLGTGVGGDAQDDVLISIENVTGSGLADQLIGSNSDNLIIGGAGNDTLIGMGGADTLDGGADIDTLDFSAAVTAVNLDLGARTGTGSDGATLTLLNLENLIGGSGNDTLVGDSFANTLTGNDGNDLLIGGGGADVLVGGNGLNTASYNTSIGAVNVNLRSASVTTDAGIVIAAGSGKGNDAEGDTLTDIRYLVGSDFNDVLIASDLGSRLDGGKGNDTLYAGVGSDTLIGGGGIDTANYSLSTSGVSIDLYNSGATGGYADGDILSSIRNVVGSGNDDTLVGDNLVNKLVGGAGNDTIEGLAGGDTLDGGDGIDTVSYANSGNLVTVNLSVTGPQTSLGDASGDILTNFENLQGSQFNDILTGSSAVNTITGGEGDDTLAGLGGADILDGGADNDTVNYSASTQGVIVDLGAGTGLGGDAEGDTLISIESVTGSGYADRLIGSTGNNSITGGAGNDVLISLGGTDKLDGGADIDTADFSMATSAVTLNLTSKTGVGSDGANLTLLNLENLIGGTGNDTLVGDGGVNVLTGNDGDDTLTGGAGADVLDGGVGVNTASYYTASAAVSVNLSSASITTNTGVVVASNSGKGNDAEGDTLTSIRNLTGSDFNDYLVASDLGSRLDGGKGNDILVAGAGADTLVGGTGVDTANYSLSTAGVAIDLFNGTAIGGYADGDTLSGIRNLTGSNNNDTLVGDGQVNTISGGAGNDIIEGRGGADTLDGGAGTSDTVSYDNSDFGVTVNIGLGTAQASIGDAQGTSFRISRIFLVPEMMTLSQAQASQTFLQAGSETTP